MNRTLPLLALLISPDLHLRLLSAIALAASLFLPVSALADWRIQTGAEAGSLSQYGHFDIESPLIGQLGQGLVHRLSLDWGSYSFRSNEQSVDLRAPGAEYALGYQRSGSTGWWAGYLGVQHRQPDRNPERLLDETSGEPWRLGFHFEGALKLNLQWQASGRLDTYPASKGYELRGRLLRDLGQGLSIGPEASYETDQEHNAQQLGIALRSFQLLPGLESMLRGGFERNDEGKSGAFIGLEFYRNF